MSFEKIKNIINDKSRLILYLSIIIYIILFSFLSLKKYYIFGYNAFDLAIFNQVFYNTIHGDWFAGTVNLNIYLADHFTPIIIFLLPFYYLKQSAESLLVIQSVFLGLSAWPLYKIALRINKDKLIALGISLIWLFNPYLHSANLFEFHLISIAVFFIFWAFYFYIKNNFPVFALFFILAILVREDISLLLLGFPLLSYLDNKKLKWKLFTFFTPLIYFFLSMKIISHFSETGNTKFIIYYSWLGGDGLLSVLWAWFSHPINFVLHILSPINIGGIFIILLPVLFLPLINKKYLLLLLFPFTQFILTSSGINFMIYLTHYILFLLPAIFISIVYSFRDIKNKKVFWGSKIIYNHKALFYFFLFFSAIYFSLTLSPIRGMAFYNYDKQKITEAKDFFLYIKDEEVVATQASFIANLSSRSFIYPLHYAYFGSGQFAYSDFDLPRVDKILLDTDDFVALLVERETSPLLQDDKRAMPTNFRRVLEDYNLTQAKNNYLLWEDKAKSSRNLKLYNIIDKPEDVNLENFLIEQTIVANLDKKSLKLSFQKHSEDYTNYIIRFYRGNYYYEVPLDYGLLPEFEWKDDKLYEFYYFPDENVESFEIFSWIGENKLGHIREVVSDLEVLSVVDKIDL